MVSHCPFPPSADSSQSLIRRRTDSPLAKEARMNHWVYVLESTNDGARYIGSTSKSVEERLARHNRGDYRYTKGHRPWRVAYAEDFKSRSEAVKRERFFKERGRARRVKTITSYQHCPVVKWYHTALFRLRRIRLRASSVEGRIRLWRRRRG